MNEQINVDVSGINIYLDLVNASKILHLIHRSHESWSVTATRAQKCVPSRAYAREWICT